MTTGPTRTPPTEQRTEPATNMGGNRRAPAAPIIVVLVLLCLIAAVLLLGGGITGFAIHNPTNETLTMSNAPLDCNNPDPNRQPLDCILSNPSAYLDENDTLWETANHTIVARLTRIGNLIINGTLVEHTDKRPGMNDYAIANGTIWIETATGDLYLRGTLTEANANIITSDGLAPIPNTHGLVLALLNPQSGDLTLRGNLITNRTLT